MMEFFRNRKHRVDPAEFARLEHRVYRLEDKMAAFDDLEADIQNQKSVTASAVALINGFKDQLTQLAAQAQQAPITADQINQLKAELEQNTSDLANAVSANTPASTTTGTAATP